MASVNEYKIVQKLGQGGYGEIFSVRSPNEPGFFALKTENIESPNKAILNELQILKHLPMDHCFPHVIAEGKTSAIFYFVMDLFGPSLSELRHKIDGCHFSMITTIRVARETIRIIERLHGSGVVHCDIKPSNFLLNKVSIGGFVLIDYGLSSFWKDPKTEEHIPQKKTNGFRGTLKYASTNVHKMIEPSRRDDIISWFYSIVELAKGELPWKNVKDHNLSMSCKQTITPEKLCSGLPKQFIAIWNSIKNLKFTDTPNYDFLKEQLDEALAENTDDDDDCYEWEIDKLIIHQISPHPELFDSKLAKLTSEPETQNNDKKHKKCLIC